MHGDRGDAGRILALSGGHSTSVAHLCTWVARVAPDLGVTPIFARCDASAAQEMAAAAGYRVLPLDDLAVGMAARLSTRMARPLTVADPELLQDKWGQRTAFALHGVPSPPFALVETPGDVRECGRRWGYPLMLKPVSGTGSRGVCRVDDPAGIEGSLAAARRGARASGVDRVLAEGYLDGPDIAVESIVLDGVTHDVTISQSGWRGNLWQAAAPMEPTLLPHMAAIGAAVARANEALGLRWAATSNELRLTAGGPAVVEVNARLGGGFCEDAVLAHTGIDRVRAMLAMLGGAMPEVRPLRQEPVAQTAIRAAEAGLVEAVEAPPDLIADANARIDVQVAPGMVIAEPEAHYIGWLLLRGAPGEGAEHLLRRAADAAHRVRVVYGAPPSSSG